MKKILAVLFTFAICMAASAQINPDAKPAALNVKPVKIGEYFSFTADNGMEVFLIRKAGYPKFRFSINFNLPTLFEEQQPEIRKITQDILEKGSTRFSGKKITEISEQLAGNVSSSINTVVCDGLKRDLNQLMPMLSGYLQSPIINKDTITAAIEKEINALTEQKEITKKKTEWLGTLIDSLSLNKNGNPEPKKATIDGYKAVSASDVQQYMKSYLNPRNSFCLVTGDFTVEEVKALIARNFNKWRGGEKFVSTFENKYKPNYPTDRKIYVVDKPGAVQSNISISWPLIDGFPYGDNEPVLLIMNQIYGAGFNSKLNQNLRGDKGLTYGASNFLSLNITGGSCTSQASVRTAETAYALENIFFEMLRVRNEKVSQEDLDMAINGMLGDYARSISQLNSPTILGFCMVKSEFKLPNDYLDTYPNKISKITAEDVRKTAQNYIQPYACNVVISGNLAELKGKLEKFGPVFYYTSKGIRVY